MTARNTIKVSGSTDVQGVANSVFRGVIKQVEEDDEINIVLRVIGAGALNQAIKGIAIARGNLATRAIDIAVIPGFDSVADRNQPLKDISVIVLRLVLLN